MRILTKVWSLIILTFSGLIVCAYAQSIPAIPVTVEQIDTLANKSDKWLFLASIIVLLFFVAFVIKLLISQLDSEREAKTQANKDLIEHFKTNAAEFKVALQANTDVLALSNITNKEISRLLQDDHRVLTLLQDERERKGI